MSKEEYELKPKPCETCEIKESCYVKCPRFENWFRASWREVVKPFRELSQWKQEQKEKENKK